LPISDCGTHVHQGITRELRRWSKTGKARCTDWRNSRPRMDKDSKAGFDCVRRVADCTWWKGTEARLCSFGAGRRNFEFRCVMALDC
jgi:hypothetical protein